MKTEAISALPRPTVESPQGFWALTWVHLLNDGLANYLPGILPFLGAVLHLPLPSIAGLMSILLFGQMLQPVSGIVADRLGGRSLAIWGPVLTALAVVGVAVTRHYWMLAVLFLITGIGNTIFHPQALTMIRSVSQKGHGVTMSLFLIGGEVGRALGPVAAGWIVAREGLGSMWLMALPLALTWPWLARRLPRLEAKPRGPAVRWAQHLRPGIALIVFSGLRAAVIYGLSTFLPLLWRQTGGSLVVAASLVTTFIGIGVAGNLGAGAVADRYGKAVVLWGSTLLSVVLLLFLPMARGVWLWPLVAALGIALFASLPVTMILGQDIFYENPAMGSGVALGLGNGLGALLLPVLGAISAHVGILSGFWVLAGLMGLTMGAIPFMRAKPRPI
mgnify:CR=1 FL=1